MKMNGLLRQAQLFCKRNASTILTVTGGAGVVATTVMAVKATPKALQLIEEAKKEKGEELTTMEKVRVAGIKYVPTVITGAATIACIFGANALNKNQQAALMSAYALVDNSYKEYKGKVKELYGEETHQEIVNAIMIEKAEDVYVHSECLCMNCDLSTEENDGQPKTFYDEHSNRYFEATIEQVITAEYHFNRNYTMRGYGVLNELYEFLGLQTTDYGSVLGWAINDDEIYWVDFNHRKVVLPDGMEVYIIETPFEPTYEPWDY